MVRVLACHAKSRGFESRFSRTIPKVKPVLVNDKKNTMNQITTNSTSNYGTSFTDLLEAKFHIGHLASRLHPKMKVVSIVYITRKVKHISEHSPFFVGNCSISYKIYKT